MSSFICPYCTEQTFSAPSERLLLTHVRLVHSLEPNFTIQCSEGGCSRTFKNFRTYQNHLLTHRQQDLPLFTADTSTAIDRGESRSASTLQLPEGIALKRYAARWILKTSETRSLTRQASLGVVEDTSFLVKYITESLKGHVSSVLESEVVQSSVKTKVEELFVSCLAQPFSGLMSFHQQLCYYRTHFNLIEPRRIVLKKSSVLRLSGRKRKVVVKKTEVMYIPLLDSLQNLLHNDTVLQEVETSHTRTLGSNMLEDYCDGQHFHQHPLYSTDPTALQIILYYDELELCNPLGSRRKKHKIGAFYYMLGNIRPQFRSRINTIQLLELAPYSAVVEYGIDRVIEPVVEDLLKLESSEGVTFTIRGSETRLRGAVTVVSADNPASSLLSGFKQSASAFRLCRHCTGCGDDIQSKFLEASFKLRSADEHRRHCELIAGQDLSTADQEHFSMTFGVNRHALLNTLQFVDVTSGSFIPDVMHDILEGILPLEMKLMLKVFVLSDKFLTLQVIDDGFERLNLRTFDGDKPSPLIGVLLSTSANDGNLRQHDWYFSAMQMWTLGRFLPLVIGHLIPAGNENWENFLRLLDIMDVIFARRLPKDQCGYLESLISDHHSCFKELYPEASITLKMHSMVHMPRLCLKFGPLVNHWTTRFEAKHKYFKHLANIMGNFTNVCYSLAVRHQLRQCYLSLDNSLLPNEEVEIGPEKNAYSVKLVTKFNSLYTLAKTEEEMSILDFCKITADHLLRANWVKVQGTEYRTPFTIIVGLDSNEELKFGSVCAVYADGQTVLFEFTPMITQEFNIHSHSYILTSPPITERDTFLIKQSDLPDYHPYGLYTLSGAQHVVTRSNVYFV